MSNPVTPQVHVLLIGTDPRQTEAYAELLRESGRVRVDVLSAVDNAAEWVGRFSYQLVVIDGAGGLDVLSLLEQVKRLNPEASAIVIADPASVEQAVAAIKLGAEDYLRKPFNMEAFRLAVKRSLDRKAVFSGNSGATQYLHLINACQLISSTLEQPKVFETIQSFFRRELSSQHTAIYTVAGQETLRVDVPGGSAPKDRAMEEIMDIALQALGPLPKMSAAPETDFFRFVERGQLTPGLFIFRFRCSGPADFFCVCLSPERPVPMEAFEGRLRMLKAQIEVTGRNIEHYQGVAQLAYLDDATGLYNTRYLHTILDREIAQSGETGKPFAVLFIDADRFKSVNDNHGHLIGTKLLNALGAHLKVYLRDSDTVFRYGGDEFVAVLSPCDLETARTVAERIRSSVEASAFLESEGVSLKFTVSIGVAIFPDHAASKEAVIQAADQAMYGAKRKSRNSVFVAELPPSSGSAPVPSSPAASDPASAAASGQPPAGLTVTPPPKGEKKSG